MRQNHSTDEDRIMASKITESRNYDSTHDIGKHENKLGLSLTPFVNSPF